MNSAICRLFLDSKKFLEMSFPGWFFLLHKSLCFSPWQPHNSRAQLSSDSTNRTLQNTHFGARVSPPSPSSSAKTLPKKALKKKKKRRPNDYNHYEWGHVLALTRAHMWHATEICAQKTRWASGASRARAFGLVQCDRRQLGTVNLRDPRLKQQQVPNKYTGQSIT